MIINYNNTIEDLIELNKYINKNKIGKYSKLFYFFRYFRYFLFIYFLFFMIYYYIISKNFIFIKYGVPITLILGIFGYLVTDSALGNKLIRSVNRLIENSPHIFDNKTIELTESYLRIFKDSDEKILYLKDITRVVENKYDIYIFFKENSDFIVIPYSAFKDEDQKKEFIKNVV